MNFKVVSGILGAAVVVGILYFVTRNKSVKSSEETGHDDKKSTDTVTHTSVPAEEERFPLNRIKTDAAETMRERHEEAQREMRKSVDNIFNGAGNEATKNEEAIKKMFEDLDNI